jgi:hypothetical protein
MEEASLPVFPPYGWRKPPSRFFLHMDGGSLPPSLPPGSSLPPKKKIEKNKKTLDN